MKCPFRKIITKENTYGTGGNFGKVQKAVITEDFPECYGSECPYYNSNAEECEKIMGVFE